MLVQSLGREAPLEKGMAPHSSILAGKSHGQRSLAGCSPWVTKSCPQLTKQQQKLLFNRVSLSDLHLIYLILRAILWIIPGT